ncbi:MAG: mechanosensitive ion channel family protein [Rhodobacteraceae bacterium]|nr:mechanosensitive ion channel family protein [Paracoccaceae bacterium]
MIARILTSFAIVLTFAVSPAPAEAQISLGVSSSAPETITLPDPLTPQSVRELVARLSDDQVRGLLLDRLDAVAEAESATREQVSLGATINTLWTAFHTPLVGAVKAIPVTLSKQAEAIANFVATFGSAGVWSMLGFTALALAAGFAAEYGLGFFTRRWQTAEVAQDDTTLWTSLSHLFRRFIREIAGLVAFFIVLRTVGQALLDPQQMVFMAPFVLYLVWVPRLTAALLRFILAPTRADLRLVNVSDRWAKYLYFHLVGLVFASGVIRFVVEFNLANGIPLAELRIGFWLTVGLHIYMVVIAWTAREGLAEIIRGTDPDRTRFDETVARYYPFYVAAISAFMLILLIVITGLGKVAILVGAPQYTTMFWLFLLPAFDSLIRGLVRHLLAPMIGEGAVAETAYKSTKRSFIRIGRVVAGIFVLLMIIGVWNIDLHNLAAAGVGSNLAGNLIEFLMISAIGYIIFELVSLSFNRRLAREMTSGDGDVAEAGGEGGGAGGSRLATVLPLMRMTAQVAIATIFGLVALAALGVDTTPLLAGAGILGLAIGFGAQKLVTDIVSGIFFLIDDAFRVGEYVDIGGTMGVVEKISIRSMQLRHHRGLVHTVPYGEIPKLTNFSRDWVIMKLKFTVPFDADPNKIKKVFKKIGAEMMQDPIHKDGFLEPFKSQGVFEFNDVGMVMRGKFMAKPGAQFTIRKEVYNRVKTELEAIGIPFARREVRVAIQGMDHGQNVSDEGKVKIAATAAAAEVAEVARLEQVDGTKK